MPKVQQVRAYCAQCVSKCGVVAEVADGRLQRLRPDRHHPSGGLCAIGAAAPAILARPDRLTHPLRRTRPKGGEDAGWERISWDEALATIAGKLRQVRQESGAEAVACSCPTVSAGGSADWLPYLERFCNLLGTPNRIATTALCQWSRDQGSRLTYGTGLPNPDYDQASLIVIWGHNPAHTNLQAWQQIRAAQRRGARLMVVDSRRTATAAAADLWLAPASGTDGALILGLIRHLLHEGWYDAEFLRHWTNAPFLVDRATGRLLRPGGSDRPGANPSPGVGDTFTYLVLDQAGQPAPVDVRQPPAAWGLTPRLFGTCRLATGPAATVLRLLQEQVARWDWGAVVAETGVPGSQLAAAAEMLGPLRPWCYFSWNGIEQHVNSGATNRALCILYSLTGCLDAPGGNVYFPEFPVQPVEGREFLSPVQRQKRLGLAARPLGAPPTGCDLARSVLEGQPYRVRALLSFGGNMVTQMPDAARTIQALQALEFHVHIDFLPNPALRFADLVLPAASYWESPGLQVGYRTAGMLGGRPDCARLVQYRPPVAKAPGEARPDLTILMDLAHALGFGDAFWAGDIDAAFDEHLAPAVLTVAELRRQPGGVILPLPVRYKKYAENTATGARGWATPTRKVEIYSETLLAHGQPALPAYRRPETLPAPTAPPPDPADFPLVLSSYKLRYMCHSQHRGVPSLRRLHPQPLAQIHPETTAALGLADGDQVVLESPTGSVTMRLQVTGDVHPGTVHAQAGWWEGCPELGLPGYDPCSATGANLNHLVPSTPLDPVSGAAAIKSGRCRIRRAP